MQLSTAGLSEGTVNRIPENNVREGGERGRGKRVMEEGGEGRRGGEGKEGGEKREGGTIWGIGALLNQITS